MGLGPTQTQRVFLVAPTSCCVQTPEQVPSQALVSWPGEGWVLTATQDGVLRPR